MHIHEHCVSHSSAEGQNALYKTRLSFDATLSNSFSEREPPSWESGVSSKSVAVDTGIPRKQILESIFSIKSSIHGGNGKVECKFIHLERHGAMRQPRFRQVPWSGDPSSRLLHSCLVDVLTGLSITLHNNDCIAGDVVRSAAALVSILTTRTLKYL
ncbi:hypothetical protein K491DRAFT_200361 [Lophiostoma macrostomum CBS 122681]|uniref:Uncharacterized protein n=1 Tax=Lophiostoma macrostomum CBS 122681 TaxID=1314788 RepID=A0A6A6SP73_9PLEO|nr:hypothetical protein K491DRAFT_200361 [Lophiostoma macrostomum CBS 122681]